MKFDKVSETFSERKEKGSIKESLISAEEVLNEITEIAMHKLDMYTDEDGNQPFDIDDEKVEALSESIKENGQLEPIIVRKKDGRYQILSGHHRYLALKSITAKYALATVVDVSDLKAYMIVCESNIHHAAPPPSKLCKIFLRYRAAGKEEKLTADQLAKMFGISREQMYRIIAMDTLTTPMQELVDAGLISTNSIKQLRTLTPDQQDTLADYVYNEDKKLNKAKCDKVVDLFTTNYNATVEDIDDCLNSDDKEKEPATNYNAMKKMSKEQLADYIFANMERFKSSADILSFLCEKGEI
ncbi:ParB/RepB/Spo0J family partition protein [Ruminococcus albus]|uniref:ParB/RepB/Spo0J family partition protein n=1 Tax=Ruminococcus albus TaxID=1264 RepID=UPI000464B645|nr:ParB/RepB/Spo0J family partition protein [Ruminococcus albus]